MSIRRLGPADLPDFQAIRLEALRLEPAAYASSYDEWARLSAGDWEARLTSTAVFASFDGSTPVGLIGLIPEVRPRMAHRGHVVMVYLRASHRGSGRAGALMAAAEAEARRLGLRQIELDTSSDNPIALRFYGKCGFSEFGRLPAGHLHEGREVDKIMMLKRLTGPVN